MAALPRAPHADEYIGRRTGEGEERAHLRGARLFLPPPCLHFGQERGDRHSDGARGGVRA